MSNREPDDRSIWKGFLAGAAGGLVASWAMNKSASVMGALNGKGETSQTRRHPTQRIEPDEGPQDQREAPGTDETPTVRSASLLAHKVLHRELTDQEKQIAGPFIHFAFGAATGGIYGVLAEIAPKTASGAGLPFGLAVWLGADETALPALGLTKLPDYPLGQHIRGLAMHLVYGSATEGVRRAVRAAL